MPEIQQVAYRFETTAAVGEWRILSFRLEERLSTPYVCVVSVAQPELDGHDPETILGADCVITLSRGDAIERRQSGLIRKVTHDGTSFGEVVLTLEIVPAVFALTQQVNSRIFQNLDAKAIIKDVLETGLSPYGRAIRDGDITRTLPKREYTVQYRETDLEFVERLMEEEGIVYCFDHAGEVEELVLMDSNDAYAPCETIAGGAIPARPESDESTEIETITSLEWDSSMRPTSVVVRDFDWSQPAKDLTKEARATDVPGRDRELYESGAITTIGDYSPTKYGADDAKEQIRLRQESEKVQEEVGTGKSDVISIRPGVSFDLTDHALDVRNDAYVVLEAVHEGDAIDGITRGSHREGAHVVYRNQFRVAPRSVPYRSPRRRPELRMVGPQTATVVGPAGEEIHTDEHGRVKVQFHWDREGKKDEKSTCFIRVAQWWASAGFGAMFIPRIGMEVVVQFLGGHPDRPLITGCVYNGQNPTTHALPDHKTKSVFYTNSSTGGGGFNELTFEDIAGSEEIYIHAQKDWNVDILNDRTTNVGNNQDHKVDANRKKHIGANHTATIDGNDKTTVSGNKKLTLTGDDTSTMSSNRALTLSGDDTDTTSGNVTTAISGNERLSVSGSQTVGIGGNKTHSIGGTYTINVGSGNTLAITVLGEQVEIISGTSSTTGSSSNNTESGSGTKKESRAVWVKLNLAAELKTERAYRVTCTVGADLKTGKSKNSIWATEDNTTDTLANLRINGAGSKASLAPGRITLTKGGTTVKMTSQVDIDATRTLFTGHVTLKKKMYAAKGSLTINGEIEHPNFKA